MRSSWLAIIALAAGLVACGEDGPAPLTSNEFSLRWTSMYCARLAECGASSGGELCERANWGVAALARQGVTNEMLASGRGRFDEPSAAACLQALEQASCSALFGLEPLTWVDASCLLVYRPDQKEGEPCTLDPRNRLGADCEEGLVCAGRTTCAPDQCCDGVCMASGEPPAGEGEVCGAFGDCAWWLTCGDDGHCIVPRAAGDRCDHYCVGETVCDGGRCAPAPSLESITSCNAVSVTGYCDATHWCGPDDRCVALRGVGEPCGAGVGVCEWLFECRADTMTCQPRRSVGERCETSAECLGVPSLCEAGVCLEPHADGEACAADEACMSGTCDDGACRPRSVCDVVLGR